MGNESVIILSLLLAAVIFSGCAQTSVPAQGNNSSQTTVPVVTNQTQNNQSQVQQREAVGVSIKNFAFNPSTLTVKVGETVRWTNDDSAPHQIAGGFANSPVLPQGATFEFTFTTAGTYDYHCAIHPSMKGTIVVQ